MSHNYPEIYEKLQSNMGKIARDLPATVAGFAGMHKSSTKDGALPGKVKELMALAISVAVRCDGCIAYHTHDALRAGASREEVLEAIGVAIMMGGGPAMVYAGEAYQALEQFSSK